MAHANGTSEESTEKQKRTSPNEFSDRALKPIETEIARKKERIKKLEKRRDDRFDADNQEIAVLQTSIDKASAMLEELRRKEGAEAAPVEKAA